MLKAFVAPLRFLLDLFIRFVEDEGLASAGYLAFVGLMSLLPFLVFVISLLGLIGQADQGAGIVRTMFEMMPGEAGGTLEGPVREIVSRASGNVLTLSILVAFWIAGSGLEGIRSALNRAYRIRETRSYWRRRAQSTVLVVLFSGLVVVAVACMIVGPVLWEQADAFLDIGLPPQAQDFPDELQYGIGAAAMFIVTAALYHFLPNRRPGWIDVVPGAAAVCVLISAATEALAFYLEHLARYSAIYGSLGGVISTLIFFYLLGAIFVLGAEFNAMLAERTDAGKS